MGKTNFIQLPISSNNLMKARNQFVSLDVFGHFADFVVSSDYVVPLSTARVLDTLDLHVMTPLKRQRVQSIKRSKRIFWDVKLRAELNR